MYKKNQKNRETALFLQNKLVKIVKKSLFY